MIEVRGRKFIVVRDAAGPRIVYERVTSNKGHPYLECQANLSRWHRNHADKMPRRGLIAEVLRVNEERNNVKD